MKVIHKSDFSVSDTACKSATVKALKQWYQELDGIDGSKLGRRDLVHQSPDAD